MKKQPKITDATREVFITTCFQLAEVKNIYSITIREITDLAGYNRTTFYRYFQDIFALIEYAEDEFINDLLDSILPLLGESNALNDDFFRIYLSKFREYKDRLHVLLSDQNRAHFIRRIQEKTLHRMNSTIADTPKNKIVMNIYLTGIFSALAAQVKNPKSISDEELLGITRRLFTLWYWPEVTGEGKEDSTLNKK
ncbi:transcriptional regulator [Streptococcus gallolyticus]|uniref:Transcriptional regulator n=1 Tax=Streptococcus gallolyticus TaxID=315405 RepID=A0AA94M123_9STRE|nr:TetR/AcrR family transcriptional regulator [Streptococcus gallolyticus]AQP41298.1 TetR family transcriptional regulator [Streptococcus gallolyticus subsp. gallolyticus DSM 16831]SQG78578.1 transcriptional regulator [Streptococcus gallolyticus]